VDRRIHFSYLGERHHETRVFWEARFNEIGKLIASDIRTGQEVPKSLDGLKAKGWLSDAQVEFLQSNKVVYTAPTTAAEDQVILRMRYHDDVDLVIQRDGFMKREKALRSP